MAKRKILIGLSVLISLICCCVLTLSHYRYYDYHKAECQDASGHIGSGLINADLIGTFDGSRPTVRANPYYLRIELNHAAVKNQSNERVTISELVSLNSKIIVKMDPLEKITSKKLSRSEKGAVYLEPSIEFPYEDLKMSGAVTFFENGDEKGFPFVCYFKRDYKQEWRNFLLDILMSV